MQFQWIRSGTLPTRAATPMQAWLEHARHTGDIPVSHAVAGSRALRTCEGSDGQCA